MLPSKEGIVRLDFTWEVFDGADAGKVRLTVAELRPKEHSLARLTGDELLLANWQLVGNEVYTGSGGEHPQLTLRSTTIEGAKPYGSSLQLACNEHAQSVRMAGAKPVPSHNGCTGASSWNPTASHFVATLGCQIVGNPHDEAENEPTISGPSVLEFTARPGIEYVYENSDCVFQGGTYRTVAQGR
jgi:hypothetical protein